MHLGLLKVKRSDGGYMVKQRKGCFDHHSIAFWSYHYILPGNYQKDNESTSPACLNELLPILLPMFGWCLLRIGLNK